MDVSLSLIIFSEIVVFHHCKKVFAEATDVIGITGFLNVA